MCLFAPAQAAPSNVTTTTVKGCSDVVVQPARCVWHAWHMAGSAAAICQHAAPLARPATRVARAGVARMGWGRLLFKTYFLYVLEYSQYSNGIRHTVPSRTTAATAWSGWVSIGQLVPQQNNSSDSNRIIRRTRVLPRGASCSPAAMHGLRQGVGKVALHLDLDDQSRSRSR